MECAGRSGEPKSRIGRNVPRRELMGNHMCGGQFDGIPPFGSSSFSKWQIFRRCLQRNRIPPAGGISGFQLCQETETLNWPRSKLMLGKILCNKCMVSMQGHGYHA